MAAVAAALVISSCARAPATRRYELHGQIIAVAPEKAEVLVKHDDIKGFMPGMTMPFKVRNRGLITNRAPGDLITATLVVEQDAAYLATLEKTGSAPVDAPPPAPTGSSGFELLQPGAPVPDQRFTDQSGRERRLSQWRGRAMALTFIYTRCPVPTFCPLMDRQFATIQRALQNEPALKARVHLLSVSFDPGYDTPPVLKKHAAALHADPSLWSFLTGDRDEIDRFASRLGVTVVRDADPASITHNLRTAVISPSGRLVKIYTGIDWTPQQVLQDLEGQVDH